MGRLQVGWEVGLGKGFQVQAQVPFDIKGSGIKYYDLNGAAYTPPYAGIHHRNEVLSGFGDVRLTTRHVSRLGDLVTLSVAVGVSLPTGKAEENPFTLAALSKKHQHFQFGTGIFMPTAQFGLLVRKDRFGLQLWGSTQFAPYANRKGFKPGVSGTWGIAPQIKIHPRVDLFLPFEGVHQAKVTWNDVPASSSGKHTLRTGLMVGITLKRGLWLYTQGSATVWQQSLSSDTNDQVLEPFMGTLGISWSPDKPLWGKE